MTRKLNNLPEIQRNKMSTLKDNLEKLVRLQKKISNNENSSVNVAFKCSCDC